MSDPMEITVKQNSEKLANIERDAKKIEKRINTCDDQLRKLYQLYFPDRDYDEYMETDQY